MRKTLLIMSALLSGALMANADVYVTVDGAGNGDGSSWANAKNASDLRSLFTGTETLHIAGGEYVLVDADNGQINITDAELTINGSEDASNPTVFRINNASTWNMFVSQNSALQFNNITFNGTYKNIKDWARNRVIEAKGTDLELNNCEVAYMNQHDTEGMFWAIDSDGAANFFRFNHCHFHHNGVQQGVIACSGGQDHTAYLNDCRFENNASRGWGTDINWRKNIFIINCSFWGNSPLDGGNNSPIINATGTPVIANSSFYNCNNQAWNGTIRSQRGLVMNNIILSSCGKRSFEVADNSKDTKVFFNVYCGDNDLTIDDTNTKAGKVIMAPIDGVLDVKSNLSIGQKPTLDLIRGAIEETNGGEMFLAWLGDDFGKDALGNTRNADAVTPGARETLTGNIIAGKEICVAPYQTGKGDGSSFANAISAAELYARLHETNSSLAGTTFKLTEGVFKFPYRIYLHTDGDFTIEGGYTAAGSKSDDVVSTLLCDYYYDGDNAQFMFMEKASQDEIPTVTLRDLTFEGERNYWNNAHTTCLFAATIKPVIENCIFHGWSAKDNTAVIASNQPMTLKNVVIDNCSGIRLVRTENGDATLFADCLTISNNRITGWWATPLSLKGETYLNNIVLYGNRYEGNDQGRGFAINSDHNLFIANSTIDGTSPLADKTYTEFSFIRAAGDGHTGKAINTVLQTENANPYADNSTSAGYNASNIEGSHETDVKLEDNSFVDGTYKPAKAFTTNKATRAQIEECAKSVGSKGADFLAWLGEDIAKDLDGKARPASGFHPGAYEFASATGIEDTVVSTDAVPVEYYDLNGRKLDRPVHGVNIVKMSDGSARKMIVR